MKYYFKRVNEKEEGCTHNLPCHSHFMTIDLASLRNRDKARQVFTGGGAKGSFSPNVGTVLPVVMYACAK